MRILNKGVKTPKLVNVTPKDRYEVKCSCGFHAIDHASNIEVLVENCPTCDDKLKWYKNNLRLSPITLTHDQQEEISHLVWR